MEKYEGVRGRARVEAINAAIAASGAKIVGPANPVVAPFEYRIRTAENKTIDLVCYAFTANKYGQEERPADEHRFQVKYGSDFDRPHKLLIDLSRQRVTLMFGVHDSRPLFIAVDPAMHSPTWFSSSVEFKEADLREAEARGWHAWERERMVGGRRRAHPPFDLRTEAVLAFRPEHFATYVLFERIATGMDAGERLLLLDHLGELLSSGRSALPLLQVPKKMGVIEMARHPLLAHLGLTTNELLDVLGGRFRLLAAVRGGVAEFHLEKLLRSTKGIVNVERFDKDAQPDFRVEYRRSKLRIECKNVGRKRVRGMPKVDFQKTRAARGNYCSRYYTPDQFEVLAACLHPLSERWEFKFCPTKQLEAHPQCKGHLSEHVRVGGDDWTEHLAKVLDRLTV